MIFTRPNEQTPFRIGIIVPTITSQDGVIGTFINKTAQELAKMSNRGTQLHIHANLLNEKSFILFAQDMEKKPYDLLWAISPLPQAQVLKLYRDYRVTIPTLITSYEHAIPTSLPSHFSALGICDDSKVVSTVLNAYVNTRKTVVICGRSSMITLNPGINNLVNHLAEKEVKSVLLPIDEHLHDLDGFMREHAPHASVIRLTTDPFTLNHTSHMVELAHRHNCKIFSTVTDAIGLGVDGIIGTDICDLSRENATYLLSLLNGGPSVVRNYEYQRTIYLPANINPAALAKQIPDTHRIIFMTPHEGTQHGATP